LSLEKKDIKYGFWNIKNRKPEYLTFDNNKINKVKWLGIGFQNEENKTKELKIWNGTLEQLDNVKYIWTYHKLNQTTFESICRMKNLKGINIKWSSIKDLECLKDKTEIEHLNLGSSTSIGSIKPICELPKLITLESENLKKVSDWKYVANLKQLEGLGINGGMYERLKLKSIDFISELINLKYLYFMSTKILDNSLKPIEGLKELKNLRLTQEWSEEEFIQLRNKLPKLKYGNVANDKQTQHLKRIFGK
jgi:Leucine-rich repeat (LRR) protein